MTIHEASPQEHYPAVPPGGEDDSALRAIEDQNNAQRLLDESVEHTIEKAKPELDRLSERGVIFGDDPSRLRRVVLSLKVKKAQRSRPV